MRTLLDRHFGAIIQIIIILFLAIGGYFVTQGKADSALLQSGQNKIHMVTLEKEYSNHCVKDANSKGEIKGDIGIIKNEMENLNKRMREQTSIQANTAKKVDNLSTVLLRFISDEQIRRANHD